MKKLLLSGAIIGGLVVASSIHHTTSCTSKNDLPDPKCTPGAINHQVTQANIRQTICRRGWTKTVRPNWHYTYSLKKKQIVTYGYTDHATRNYEEDHLIPLELGGAPTDPRNLWPEPEASPNPKDDIEYTLNRAVCSGKISLNEAQAKIARNWKTAAEGLQ